MNCPQCKTERMLPTQLEPTLGAMGCPRCNGALVDLVAYRLWADRYRSESAAPVAAIQEPEAASRAILCSRCSRIMLRFRYTQGTPHVLDLCSHCDDVWLQDGEWEFLKHLKLDDELTRIFTDPWQRELRDSRTRDRLEKDWDRRVGADVHVRLREIRAWLEAHPDKEHLLDYLRAEDPYDV